MQTKQTETYEIEVLEVPVFIEESGFFVMTAKMNGEQHSFTGVSIMSPVRGPMTVEAYPSVHPKYGPQYKVTRVFNRDMGTIMRKLFMSGFLVGIREGKADAIVETLGVDTFRILDAAVDAPDTPIAWNGLQTLPSEILQTVYGIGPRNVLTLIDSWEARRYVVGPAMLAIRVDMTGQQYRECIEKLGPGQFEYVVTNEPYSLLRLDTFRWKDADRIANEPIEGRKPIRPDDPTRVTAAFLEAMKDQERLGHTAVPKEKAFHNARVLLQTNTIDVEAIVQSSAELYYEHDGMVQLEKNYYIESQTVLSIRDIIRGPMETPIEQVVRVEDFSTYELSDEQTEAVYMALAEPFCIVTGGPGTGKTTAFLSTALKIFDRFGISYTLAAPTGIAAENMFKATGIEAFTLHRYFALYREERDFEDLDTDVLVIDEFSMVAGDIFRDVLSCVARGKRVILIGDKDQLPPVGAGEPLAQLLQTDIPRVHLTQIFRQADGSGIIAAAHDIVHGEIPQQGNGFMYVTEQNGTIVDRTMSAIDYLINELQYKENEIQVLTTINGGSIGRKALNEAIRDKLNPREHTTKTRHGFALEDRVIHIKNNYDLGIMNGMIGTVVEVIGDKEDDKFFSLSDDDKEYLTVDYGNRIAKYSDENISQLQHAYALTIHKGQGSQFKAVICVFPFSHESFMLRQLIYTGVTRAQETCIVISQGNAAIRHIKNAKRVVRHSLLATIYANLPNS